MSKLLLLSNSTMPGTSFFTWPRMHVKDFLGREIREVVFIPFAAVTLSFDGYEDTVSRAFDSLGYKVKSVHRAADKTSLIGEAQAIVVGGGNTFALVKRMYDEGLVDVVRAKVAADTPYVGWSAGANLACPTLKTTNDMPVLMPPSFEALNLIPFQINPHYHELKFENQGGETRKERLEEFLLLNPDSKVIGLPEGMLIRREGGRLTIGCDGTAKLYAAGKSITDLRPGADISALLG
jgi:dipeptidase E